MTEASTGPLTETGFSRQTKLQATTGYYLMFVSLGLIAAVLGPSLPSLAERTHTRLAEISIVFTVRSLGYLVGSLVAGLAYDRGRGHPLLVFMLVATAAALVVIPMTPLLAVLVAVFFVLGATESMIDVGGNSLLIWLYRDRVGVAINGLHFAFGVGALIAPIIVAQVVLATGDISWAYWLIAVLVLPGGLFLMRLPSPTLGHSAHRVDGEKTSGPAVLLLVLFTFLYIGAEGSFGSWVYTYAITLRLADTAAAAYLTSVFWGALTVGRFVGIPIATRLKPQTILYADIVVCIASVGVLVLQPHSAELLWFATVGAGLGMASVYPAMLSFAQRRMRMTSRITGWISLGAGAGGMLLPWVIGQFFELSGAPSTMVIIAADLIVTLIVLVFLTATQSAAPAPGGQSGAHPR